MQFDLEKCAKVIYWKGSLIKSKNITSDIYTDMTELEFIKAYVYLEIN